MKGKLQCITAMILVCCLMLSLDSFVAMAEEEDKVSFDTAAKKESGTSGEFVNTGEDMEMSWMNESVNGDEELFHYFDESKRITKSDVPISIGYEEAKE